MKQASVSSTVQGGGKRRADKKLAPFTCLLVSFLRVIKI
jgi:hypothetical protein